VSSPFVQAAAARRAAGKGITCLRAAWATFAIYALGYPLTAVGVLLGCAAALVGWRAFIRVGTVVWAHMLFLLMGRIIHVSGKAAVTPGTPCLVIANHSSMFDIPALMAAVPGIAIMGRDYLTRIPVFGIFLRIIRYVPIDTRSARSARGALEQAAVTVRQGIPLAIFAEGTRTETGKVQQLKRGFVHVLRASGGDLLPVHISGTFALKPKGKIYMSPRKQIQVTIGPPVAHAALAGLSDEQIMGKVKSILEQLGGETA
jgi:1-acyl-sn-glycerol-3-phosphate acyltransferase